MHFIMRLRLMTEMYKLQQTLINPFFFEVASHQHWLVGRQSLLTSKKNRTMNCEKLQKSLKSESFLNVINNGKKFEKEAIVYAKEINHNIFLLFVILKGLDINKIYASIANFDCFESIGCKDPIQLMFHLTINKKEDFHYFEKYVNVSI